MGTTNRGYAGDGTGVKYWRHANRVQPVAYAVRRSKMPFTYTAGIHRFIFIFLDLCTVLIRGKESHSSTPLRV